VHYSTQKLFCVKTGRTETAATPVRLDQWFTHTVVQYTAIYITDSLTSFKEGAGNGFH